MEISALRTRMAVTESNRFTIYDADDLRHDWTALVDKHIASAHPPMWIRKQLDSLDTRMNTLDARDLVDRESLDALERRDKAYMDAMEKRLHR